MYTLFLIKKYKTLPILIGIIVGAIVGALAGYGIIDVPLIDSVEYGGLLVGIFGGVIFIALIRRYNFNPYLYLFP